MEPERGIIRSSAYARLCRYRHNAAERALRGAAIGRKLSFGSHSETGAELAGHLYSVFGTLALAGLRPYPWLADYLQACAESDGRPPADARAWLPWGMDESNARRCAAPPCRAPCANASAGASPTAA